MPKDNDYFLRGKLLFININIDNFYLKYKNMFILLITVSN